MNAITQALENLKQQRALLTGLGRAAQPSIDALDLVIRALDTQGEQTVSALDVFRIAGGDTECCPSPSPEQALECLRDLRERYQEALAGKAQGEAQAVGGWTEPVGFGVTITEGDWTGTYAEWKKRHGFKDPALRPAAFDMLAHLQRQREWSERTFGPGARTAGVIDHIRKELREIESDPTDISEWIDVAILALDGAWRAGYQPQQIIDALAAKQTRNEGRKWPDWRAVAADKAIEHDRSGEAPQPVTMTEADKAEHDRRLYGNGFLVAGTHVPAKQVTVVHSPQPAAWPKVWGTSRMFDNEKAVLVSFDRKPSNEEFTAFDDAIKGRTNAAPQLVVPEGMALVPVEPTDEIINAMCAEKLKRLNRLAAGKDNEGGVVQACREDYAAMLTAAQEARDG